MQLIHSEISKEKYLSDLKSSFSNPFDFFNERYCGITIGSYFYVIHHSDHQWDRKFHAPTSAALGHVCTTDTGCEISFISFKGLLCPSQLLTLLFFVFLLPVLLVVITPALSVENSSALTLYSFPLFWIISTITVIAFSGIYTLFEVMSDRSEESENQLLSLLYNPENPHI